MSKLLIVKIPILEIRKTKQIKDIIEKSLYPNSKDYDILVLPQNIEAYLADGKVDICNMSAEDLIKLIKNGDYKSEERD